MEQLQIFENREFGRVRTSDIDGKPYFMAFDIAKALGYANPRKAMSDHCKGVTKRDALTPGGIQTVNFIPESDVYRLVIKSKLPSAERFEKWVMEEVLPSIRKSGGYISGQENMSDSELMAKALLVAQRQIEERNALIETMQPKALFADAVSASKTSILVGDLAKLLNQNGVQIGQKRLFEWMREKGYLIRQKGASWNMPTQRAMELGLFEIKESTITHSDGHVSITRTVKVNGKGQVYFVNKFLKAQNAETEFAG